MLNDVKDEVPEGLTLLHVLHSPGNINRIAWSPDGRTLASASRGETIQLWDTNTGSLQHTLKGNFNFSIAWSPDEKMLASGGINFLFLWNAKTGELLVRQRTPSKSNKSIVWSLDGRILASGSDDGIIRLWYLEAKEERLVLEERLTLEKHTDDVNSIAWSPDGHTLASGSEDSTVCLWDLEAQQLIYTFTEHFGSINCIAWSPDGRTLASASSDNTIRIWDFQERRLLGTFEGHTEPIVCIAFSYDGRLLASKSLDGSVRLWRTDTKEMVVTLNEPTLSYGWYAGISFHPNAPLLATLGEKDTVIRIWRLDFHSLLGNIPFVSSIQYSNAKVVLVGDRGVGKTSLCLVLRNQPFIPPESTHGRDVWLFDSQEEVFDDGRKEIQEIFLWDLAGQPNYRLIHQLHLDEVALALIVFDANSDIHPLDGVYYWERVLKLVQHLEQISPFTMKRFLIAACIDRGKNISLTSIKKLISELRLDDYFETSAKESKGIVELREAIKGAISWETLPKVSSTVLFQRIKDFIVDLREHSLTLDFLENLYQVFLSSKFAVEESEELPAQFENSVKFMNSQGLIKQLSFGNYVLLKPELLDYYASALMNAVYDESDGLGNILVDKVTEGSFPIPEENRIKNREQEKLLLIAMIDQLQDHDIASREYTNDGSYLVFPSLSTREFPEPTDPLQKDSSFYFEGPVLNIYATLAVRLSHCGFFKKKEVGKDMVTFTAPADSPKTPPGTYGISLHNLGEGRGELTLSFDKHASNDKRSLFKLFVYDHLQTRTLPKTIRWIPRCTSCEESFTESAIRRREEFGFNTIICSGCGTEIPIYATEMPASAIYQSQVFTLNSTANERRESDRDITIRSGESSVKNLKREYDVFFCYNIKDEPTVKKIGKELMDRGIAPWLYSWDIQPGKLEQSEIERQIVYVRAAAVFFGEAGISRRQLLEINALLRQFEKRGCNLIPVLLENLSGEPELPPLLDGMKKVDFRVPDWRPYTKIDLKLEHEKRLSEAQAEGERLMAGAHADGERLMAEARERGKVLQVEVLNQGESLLAEARERGKVLQVEALNQGGSLQETLELFLEEVQRMGKRISEAQELAGYLQKNVQQDVQKLRERLLAEAQDEEERLLAEAQDEEERLLAEAQTKKKSILVAAQTEGERILADAHERGKHSVEGIHTQEELFQAEDQVPDLELSPLKLLEWGITGKRVSIH